MAEAQETIPCPNPSSVGEWCFRIRYLSQSAVYICDTFIKLFLVFPPPWYYVTVNLADVCCRFLDGKPYFHGYLCFIETIAVGVGGK